MAARTPLQGVGIGWRPEIAMELLARRAEFDFVEVVAETCVVQSRARREALAAAEIWPVIPHGVKLSLGSAEGIDEGRAKRLGELARALRAPVVTEHVAFTSAGGREIGHLTQLPRTREAVAVVARNVQRARRHLPDVPLLLENIAWAVRWPDDAMDEGSFYAEVVRATGCDLMLDLSNLHANALNEGIDPFIALDRYPLEHVALVHVAGGQWVRDHGAETRFFFDDHASPVPSTVFELLAELARRVGPVPVILERDSNFPPFDELAGEVKRARETTAGAAWPSPPRPPSPVPGEGGEELRGSGRGARSHASSLHPPLLERERGALAATQAALAATLTTLDGDIPESLARFSPWELARSREVLQRKRVDDALPLIPRVARHGDALWEAARRAVAKYPRTPRGAALADAWSIALEALASPAMAAAARTDLLVLRARFKRPRAPGEAPVARVGPFVGSVPIAGGRSLWAFKGVGSDATVRMIER